MTAKLPPWFLGTVALVGLSLVPGLVLSLTQHREVAAVSAMASVACLLAGVFAGWRIAAVTAIALGAASGLACVVTSSAAPAALLMVCCAVAVGLSAHWGLSGGLITAPIMVGFILAEPPEATAALVAVVMGISGLFSALVCWLVRHRLPNLPRHQTSLSRAAAYAAVLGVLIATATVLVVEMQYGHPGAWIILTVFVVVQPYLQDGWTKAIQRAAGTVVGFIIAVVIGAIITAPPLLYVVGTVCLLAAVGAYAQGRAYWVYAAPLTIAIVLLEGAATSVQETAGERLVATLIGVVISVCAMALLQPIYRRTALAHGVEHY